MKLAEPKEEITLEELNLYVPTQRLNGMFVTHHICPGDAKCLFLHQTGTIIAINRDDANVRFLEKGEEYISLCYLTLAENQNTIEIEK